MSFIESADLWNFILIDNSLFDYNCWVVIGNFGNVRFVPLLNLIVNLTRLNPLSIRLFRSMFNNGFNFTLKFILRLNLIIKNTDNYF